MDDYSKDGTAMTFLTLKAAIENAAEGYKPSALKKISNEITKRYKEERGDGTRLVTSKEEALVYAIVRMPATYCAVYSALSNAMQYVDGITTVLDVGAGTGAATWAVSALLNVQEVDCMEREPKMIALGKKLMDGLELSVNWIESDMAALKEKQYDLVIASYALNELAPAARKSVLDKLWRCTKKLLLIVEPGTPYAHTLQQSIRSQLTGEGAILAAPCPQGAVCCLPENDWCHFTCRVQRSKLHKQVKGVESPFEDEKFTYSAFCKVAPMRECTGRVLRHPVIQEKRITLSVCTKEGIFEKVFLKKDAFYKAAKKLNTGDEF